MSAINRGKLKIFFGYAAGVGKTYAMLKAAHDAKEDGIDVVVGYVEPHARPQTLALLEGLEIIPPREIDYRGIKVREFDIDAAIKRKPQLILVDELAHTNAATSRHLKRYQDVEELLGAGIDVYTTVNVQHIESINDMVESITGVAVRERVPDKIFNEADQVELMDIEPDDLIGRLTRGEIYKETQAKRALQNFFTRENLIALREMSLRRTAHRVNIAALQTKTPSADSPYIAGEHVLICLSSSPSNAKVVRTAARMAEAFHCPFTALYVETSSFATMPKEDRDRFNANTKLAEQLGAQIVTVYGENVPQLVADYAKISCISKIVIGRSAQKSHWFSPPNYMDKLSVYAPNIEIFVIPDKEAKAVKRRFSKLEVPKFSLSDTLKSLAFLAASTALGYLFFHLGFDESNIITVYILGVLFTAVVTDGKFYSAAASVLAVLAFNYFFTDPRYSFETHNPGYPFTFLVMFLSAFLTSTLTKRLKSQARQLSAEAHQTEVFLETSQKLQNSDDIEKIFHEIARQIIKLLDASVIMYPVVENGLGKAYFKNAQLDNASFEQLLTQNEHAVAEWVYRNNKRAGPTTDTLPDAKCLYLPIGSNSEVLAVIGISMMNGRKIEAFEKNTLTAILSQCALAIEKHNTLRRHQDFLVKSKQDKLRANLLRAISHDLRTPLAGILGSSKVLKDKAGDKNAVEKIAQEIYEEADWLHSLVENILNLTRLQDGKLLLSKEQEAAEEVASFAVASITRRYPDVKISVAAPEELLVLPMDARLISQVLINLLDNAVKHSGQKDGIAISISSQGNFARFTVTDEGKGVSDELVPQIFEAFKTAKTHPDARQGAGLGLTICEAIVKAHGGEISMQNRTDRSGVQVSFMLPIFPTEDKMLGDESV